MMMRILDCINAALVFLSWAAMGFIVICIVLLIVAQLAFELGWSDIEPLGGNMGGLF